MKEDFHELLEYHKLSVMRLVVTKSINKYPRGPSGHDCHFPGLVMEMGLKGIPLSH